MQTLAGAIRKARGLDTQEAFGLRMKVDRVAVSQWETGKAIPSLRSARLLVRAGVPAHMLLNAHVAPAATPVAGTSNDEAAA